MGQIQQLCIVTNVFLPSVGGIQIVTYEQSKRLLQKNFDLTIVTNRIQTPKKYTYENINVECYESINIGFRLGIPYTIPTIHSFPVFTKNIKNSKLVHAHGHPYLTSLIASKLAKQYEKPFILTQHNTFIDYNNVFNHIEKINDLIVGKETLKQADKIITVSNATKEYVLSIGANPNKIKVIHNGVDLNRFKPLPQIKEEMRKKIGIPKDAKVVLTVRRIVYKNGVDTLIDAANLAIKKKQHLVFIIAGKGPDMTSIQNQIEQLGLEKNIKLTGFVADQALHLYYNAADMFVLPSKSGEGLPLVALEAMACGLPVIATNVGGISEIMIKDFGKLVPANNPQTLADAIIEFADTNKSADELHAIVETQYSWDKNVSQLIELYEELI
ncbi:MAG: glycosyltransferase family 4 protein [Nitrososphaerota archaeon]|jgi:glycosyltransferase involved in cell wall biosynthesis|nr:glycosyltransferase family 4 protein [Nitrososphaerota archaeon]